MKGLTNMVKTLEEMRILGLIEIGDITEAIDNNSTLNFFWKKYVEFKRNNYQDDRKLFCNVFDIIVELSLELSNVKTKMGELAVNACIHKHERQLFDLYQSLKDRNMTA